MNDRDRLMLGIGAMQAAEATNYDPAAAPPSPRTRCTEVFTTERTARMVERVNKAEGYAHTRIDIVHGAQDGEVKFLVWASMDPLPEPEVNTSVVWFPPAEWGVRVEPSQRFGDPSLPPSTKYGRVVIDPSLPPGTIVIEQNGKELGRVILE